MNATVILSHPQEGSFSHKIAGAIVGKLKTAGFVIFYHDLYGENFNPVLRSNEISSKYSFDLQVQQYMEELSSSDLITIVHPDWWGQPPAILKGWVDRVLRSGVAYTYDGEEYGTKQLVPLLAGKKVRVFTTTDTKHSNSTGILESLWKKSVWNYCGVTDIAVQTHYNTRETGELDRQRWIDAIVQQITKC